ncbi:hypothetical protein CGA22_10875 [Pseudomonas sp. PSB18]|nr:hypothetical protein [Pseudomonas sp. SHC52]MBD0685023.1 hypothetical protein [Pseudomonas sp. PSB18]
MVSQDFDLLKQIFELIDSGIVGGYHSFIYEVEVGGGCMEAELTVENGVESTGAEVDFDSFLIFDLVEQLKENAVRRGEVWNSFVMSYRQDESVKTKFKH